MLADHNRMQAYHSAILGNQDVFRDKVVMDVGTGSGILAVWAAQAGARKVYAIEYTDMAKHAEAVMKANGVDHIVTVIQSSVEEVVLPIEQDGLEVEEDGTVRCVDIMVSEWYVVLCILCGGLYVGRTACRMQLQKDTEVVLLTYSCTFHLKKTGWVTCCCARV